MRYSKTCVKQPLSKRPQIGFQDQLLLDAGLKYCKMLQAEHSAILSTFIKLPFVIKIFVLSYFAWQFYCTGGKNSTCPLDLLLYVPVKSYGHYRTVSSPNHTFSWASLNKRLTLLDSFSGRENDRRNYFTINLHESMGPLDL